MTGPKRISWSEADVLALPAGEHDYFDRKSAALLEGGEFRIGLAKIVSALANSGGGHVVLGVEDDGTFSGAAPFRGRTRTREWLEQVIPNLVSFTLEDFRVHEVVPSLPTAIPAERVLLVIDVGDSVLAPHQSEPAKAYYYREGGHSKPAPHFYLETLRNRLTRATLEVSLVDVKRSDAYVCGDDDTGVFLETRLKFLVKNTGNIAAYKWAVVVEGTDGDPAGRESDIRFSASFPRGPRVRNSGTRLDDTILPGLTMYEEADFGLLLRGTARDREAILRDLTEVLAAELTLRYRVVTETSRGETVRTALSSFLRDAQFVESVFPLSTN